MSAPAQERHADGEPNAEHIKIAVAVQIGEFNGGLDFSYFYVRLGPIPADYSGPLNYAAL